MTTAVVTADRLAPYKEIVRLLAENRVSGLPVRCAERQVAGVVTEANLLAELMSAPAITIGQNATIAGAAREMSAHNVRRLPVVDSGGRLLGIVSRRDLLSVFLRPDGDVAADVREILGEMLPAGSGTVAVTVKDGVVVLEGPPGAGRDRVAVAIRMAWGVDAAHRASAPPQST
jgi:CBS-domain-containing membrane protein